MSESGDNQLFHPGADAIFRFAFVAVVAIIIGAFVATGLIFSSSYFTEVGVAPSQPVPFSHKHHAGELGLDCRYCHQQVETLATAGIPPTWTCMTCHSQIWTNSQMLEPIRQSLAKQQPLRWTRVNELPSYVYFNHSIHVAKGIGCSTCHGAVDTMQLTYKAHAFEMQFCIDCHRNPEKLVRPQEEVWNMDWSPPDNQAQLGADLVAAYHIGSAGRLTDCSICHR